MSDGPDGDEEVRARRLRLGGHGASFIWLVIGVIVGAFMAHPLEQSFKWVKWQSSHQFDGSPDCRDAGWYDEVPPQQATAYSQYQQKGDRPEIFTADNTHDDDPRTAWIGRFSGRADQDYIRWTLPRPTRIALICVRPGWTRDYGTLAGNLRPKDVVIRGCSEGDVHKEIPDRVNLAARTQARNAGSYYALPVKCTADEVELVVKSAHQANDDSQLIAISDVRFFTGFQVLGD